MSRERPHPPKLLCMHITSTPTCMKIFSRFHLIKFFDHRGFNGCYIMVGADGTVLEYFTLWIN